MSPPRDHGIDTVLPAQSTLSQLALLSEDSQSTSFIIMGFSHGMAVEKMGT